MALLADTSCCVPAEIQFSEDRISKHGNLARLCREWSGVTEVVPVRPKERIAIRFRYNSCSRVVASATDGSAVWRLGVSEA